MDSEPEEITLPTLPRSEPSLPVIPSFPNLNNRKRPFLRSREPSSYEDQLTEALNTSSDPPLFSSDDTPDADNYDGGMKRRKKRTYKGTWWGDNLRKTRTNRTGSADAPGQKRRFRRNFDSGIFMADDSSATDLSGTDLSSEGSLEQQLLEAQLKEGGNSGQKVNHSREMVKAHRTFRLATEAALRRMPQGRPINPKDHLIRKVVQDCLDKNDENVDWTGMSLDYLPPVITDLKSMIKRINPQSINNSLAPFEAELKLYLGNNDFTQLPLPLFELTNTQLLSVRQNSLSTISPAIRHLDNLRELNLSSNNLQHLPFEIMEMLWRGPLKMVHSSPNPWMQLPPVEDRLANAPALMVLSRSMVACRRFAVSKPVEFLPDGTTQPITDLPQHRNRQSHLSEMILRSLVRHNTSRSDLSSYLTEEHSVSVRRLLEILHSTQSSGSRLCTFCKRDIVLPRYQWYEWWDMLYDVSKDTVLKLLLPKYRNAAFLDGMSPEVLSTAQGAEILAPEAEVNNEVDGRLLPFHRMACGCISVELGLEKEVVTMVKSHHPMST